MTVRVKIVVNHLLHRIHKMQYFQVLSDTLADSHLWIKLHQIHQETLCKIRVNICITATMRLQHRFIHEGIIFIKCGYT